ncbi:hypothetical protein M758_8G144500 [Ceratodon purpureus]|nr:hypothetical protein M758_8G144500 [Ceratodon purpureus]
MSQLWSCPARSSLFRSIRRIAGNPSLSFTNNVVQNGASNGHSRGQRSRHVGAAASDSDDESEARTPPSEKVQRLAEDISTLTLLEVSDLTTLLRQKLGLPAGMGMMPMGMMPGMQMGGAAGAAPAAEEAKVEKTSFDVKLEKFDAAAKIKIIKEVRTFTALGLKEAKELVEKAPVVLKSGVGKEEAEQIIEKLKAIGANALME